jgi:heterodisulfide reductase subunit B
MNNLELAVALPVRNLALAEGLGAQELVTGCASCYQRLAIAAHETRDRTRRAHINALVDATYRGTVRPRHLLEVLSRDVGPARIQELVVRPLTGLKAACYYGCLLVRPVEATGFDDAEDPQSIDALLRAAGAEVVDWPFKTECCGASFSMSRTDLVAGMARAVLAEARAAGAECIVTACPMCQSNLDMRQGAAARLEGRAFDLPVYYLTQLLGVAMGHRPRRLGLTSHFVKALPLLERLRLAGGSRR